MGEVDMAARQLNRDANGALFGASRFFIIHFGDLCGSWRSEEFYFRGGGLDQCALRTVRASIGALVQVSIIRQLTF